MEKIRILFIDGEPFGPDEQDATALIARLIELEINADVEVPHWAGNSWCPSADDLELVKLMTLNQSYDAIVIGDYRGAGRSVVAAVASSLRDKVVVTDDSSVTPELTEAYRRLGVSHFAPRHDGEAAEIQRIIAP